MKEKLYYLLCLREEKKDWINFLDNLLKDLYYIEKSGKQVNNFKRIAFLKYHSYGLFRQEILNLLEEGDL